MKATNEGTGHTRKIVITEIPAQGHRSDLVSLTININYVYGGKDAVRADGGEDYIGDGEKAVCLDHQVIPYIIEAINSKHGLDAHLLFLVGQD